MSRLTVKILQRPNTTNPLKNRPHGIILTTEKIEGSHQASTGDNVNISFDERSKRITLESDLFMGHNRSDKEGEPRYGQRTWTIPLDKHNDGSVVISSYELLTVEIRKK
jgi:hypothetical protein